MEMQMEFIRKLPNPQDLKEEFPVTDDIRRIKEERDQEIADILTGRSDKFILIIGPCSADREDACSSSPVSIPTSPVPRA